MTESDWRITIVSQLGELNAEYRNLALRYEELSQTAQDARRALVVAQQNAMCLDNQASSLAEVRELLRAHIHASDSLMDASATIVQLAEQEKAWRVVRSQIIGAAKWIAAVVAPVVMLWQLIANWSEIWGSLADAIDKAF
jgi:hypothetical protein